MGHGEVCPKIYTNLYVSGRRTADRWEYTEKRGGEGGDAKGKGLLLPGGVTATRSSEPRTFGQVPAEKQLG